MNKELTIILATKINAYNQKVSDIRKFALSNEELEMFASAMQDFAAQEKKKEAIAILHWILSSNTDKENEQLYERFNKQK
jgi:hypothetical protein